jgi:hypothetical protein
MTILINQTTEERLRDRIERLEKTCAAYDHVCQTTRIDDIRKRLAGLDSALSDVLLLIDGEDKAAALVARGMSRERAAEILTLLTKNFYL